MPPETTRHPYDYPWRERFPRAARVLGGEGGGVYAAEDPDGTALWLIKDEGTMADFLPEEDRGGLVSLAGAPVADWELPLRGAEFFDAGRHDMALLQVLYGDWWRHWEKRGDPQPTELPRSFGTERVHTAAFEVAGTTWQLRLAAVVADDGRRIPWPRLLADDSTRARLRSRRRPVRITNEDDSP